MEQTLDRKILISFNVDSKKDDKIINATKIVYNTDGTPLYVVDSEGTFYNWLHIVSISNVIEEGA